MAKKTVVEEVLKSFGLGSVVDALKNSEAFKKRLEEVNKEIEENLKKGTGEKEPEVVYSFSVRTLRGSPGVPQGIPPSARPPRERQPFTRRERPMPKAAKGEKLEAKQELFIDIFDEGDYISVMATLPQVKKEELGVELAGETLVLTAGAFRKEVNLPCRVEAPPEVNFKNGVFDIRLQKKAHA
jgi:HSP20 family molecular chaperone IbpA